jgi:hypothetical protein
MKDNSNGGKGDPQPGTGASEHNDGPLKKGESQPDKGSLPSVGKDVPKTEPLPSGNESDSKNDQPNSKGIDRSSNKNEH